MEIVTEIEIEIGTGIEKETEIVTEKGLTGNEIAIGIETNDVEEMLTKIDMIP